MADLHALALALPETTKDAQAGRHGVAGPAAADPGDRLKPATAAAAQRPPRSARGQLPGVTPKRRSASSGSIGTTSRSLELSPSASAAKSACRSIGAAIGAGGEKIDLP